MTPVNQAPTFTQGGPQTVLESASPPTQNVQWATNIQAGPANESSQSVNFVLTGDTNPALFSVAPTISPTGILSYQVAPDANGSATVTVTLHDNGGTANGGQ